jgi:hypothetical protein
MRTCASYHRASGASFVILLAMSAAVALAQPSLPQARQPQVLLPSLESQRPAFEAYQKCVAEHRREVDLYNASREVIDFRDNRAMMEAALAQNPQMRERFPGGVDQIAAIAFARYRSFGGSATSAADVQPMATPCPPPAPQLPERESPAGDSPISQSRTLILPSGAKLPGPPPANK